MRILLLGNTGQIGWELNRSLIHLGEVLSPPHKELDLTNFCALDSIINKYGPHIIVNASAYTKVDEAEHDQTSAFTLNEDVPKLLAHLAKEHKALLIHFSTDYVFDGSKESPYIETDQATPLNIYGRSKLLGDKSIIDSGCNNFIFRTSWLYSSRRNNFLLTIISSLINKNEINVVNDQIGSPTSSYTISVLTNYVILQCRRQITDRINLDTSGLYNLVNSGNTSWYGFALEIRNNLINLGFKENSLAKINPLTTFEYGSTTYRPKNSCLSTEKFEKEFSIRIPGWKECLTNQIQSLYPNLV